jgi:hypothetical protein
MTRKQCSIAGRDLRRTQQKIVDRYFDALAVGLWLLLARPPSRICIRDWCIEVL